MQHHPAIKLFMISLISGMLVMIIATMTFLVFYTNNAKHLASVEETSTSDTNSNTSADETVPSTDTVAITGTILDITDATFNIQLQGFSELTNATILTLTTTDSTAYAVVDSRTPPLPGSGQQVTQSTIGRSDLMVGDTVSVMVRDLNDNAATARSITLIQ